MYMAGVQTNQGTILRVKNGDFDSGTVEEFVRGFKPQIKKILYTFNARVDNPLMRGGYECVEIWLPWVNPTQKAETEKAIIALSMALYHGMAEMAKKDKLPPEAEAYGIELDRDVEWETAAEGSASQAP
jgi:hypothetical protein